MESGGADPLNDTPTLPELSFDDLLDESPVKKNISNFLDDPLELNYERKTRDDETLNTPGPKKPRVPVAANKEDTDTQHNTIKPATPTIFNEIKQNAASSTTPTRPNTYTAAKTPPTILNKKIFLPKTSTATTTNHLVKIAPKTNVVGTTAATTTVGVTTVAGPKTAIKTANGQVLYIQKTTAGMSAVRLAASSAATTTVTTAASSTGAAGTASIGNKTVAIKVLRAADGTLVPLKPTIAAAAAAAKTTKSALTLSPTMATQLAGKKIITSGNHVLIKTPTSMANSTAAAQSAATATATVTNAKQNITGSGKIVVQSANGKQIVVSNQHLIKLSPKPTTSVGGATATASTTGGHFQAIQIPGKPGLQYVRVLPNSKLATAASTTTTTTIATAVASDSTTKISITGAAVATATGKTTTAPSSSSSVKILNSAPQKFTVVRPGGGTTKMVLTQSPKKNGVPVTFSPITTKVQKTIVTVPTLRKIGDSSSGSSNPHFVASSSSNSTINNSSNSSFSTVNFVRKHKISEINSQIERMTSGQPEMKKTSSGNRIVVMSRSMLRNNNNLPQLQRSGSSAGDNSHPEQQQQNIMTKVQGANSTTTALPSSSPKKLYSVLKTNSLVSTTAEFAPHPVELKTNAELKSLSGQAHPVELKTNAELKSLIICGQAQALMAQQQQHKAQQMLQKQRMLHQQQQLQQQKQLLRQLQMQQEHQQTNRFVAMKIKQEPLDPSDNRQMTLEEDVGTVRRKHCNCTKSQCLKLYCDCFANGEFCQDCNCKSCFNNLQYEDERQKAIRNCLERNPSAFKPKITTSQDQSDMRLHNKGCNCKRSGCLKNYCECYEAKIPCSSNCKCFGCRNIEDRPDLDMDPIDSKILDTLANATAGGALLIGQKRTYEKMDKSSKLLKESAKTIGANNSIDIISGCGPVAPIEKQQCNFITQEVIDATIQCMISQADECEKNALPAYQTEKMIMEELGRCLVEIIDFSIRNTDTSYSQD